MELYQQHNGRGNRKIDDYREQSGVESDFEWFQWLAERIMEYDEAKNHNQHISLTKIGNLQINSRKIPELYN